MKKIPLALLCLSSVAFPLPGVASDGVPEGLSPDTSRVVDIEEAVVVASPKENAKLRRLPVSVSLFRENDLTAYDVRSIKGLSAHAPNFFMPDYGSRLTSAVYIRGIGSRIGNPAVGLYVDNVPYADKTAYDFGFADVERVDVLRGPQGTLYGRNTMGGLVRVFTSDPWKARGTRISLGGNTGNAGRRASVSTFLHPASRLALSLSAYYDGNSGFRENDCSGEKADASDAGGGRLRLAWRPAERVDLNWVTSYEQSKENACPYYYIGAVGTENDEEPYPEAAGRISSNRQSTYRRALLVSGLDLAWRAPRFTLSSVTSFQHVGDRLFMDQDFLSADIFSLAQRQRLNTLSQELTMKSLPHRRWQWTAGAFFTYQAARTDCPVNFYGDGMDYLNGQLSSVFSSAQGMPAMSVALSGQGLAFDARLETPALNAALYHQSSLRDFLVKGLTFTLGLRVDYSRERLTLSTPAGREAAYAFSLPSFGIDAAMTASLDLAGRHRKQAVQVLPKAALQYDLPGNLGNLYASVSKGYRSGGYNIQSYSELSQSQLRRSMMLDVQAYSEAAIRQMAYLPAETRERIVAAMKSAMEPYVPGEPDVATLYYRPEFTWDYEAGARLNLFEGMLQADFSAFFMKTRNQQVARFSANGLGRTTVNAGRSHSCGVELSLRAALLDDRLTMSAAYGYARAVFTAYDAGEGRDYEGNRVPFAPAHTAAASADFRQPLSGRVFKAVSGGLSVQGAGRVYWDEANSFSQPFYATLAARVGVELPGGTQLLFWGKNLTDTRYDTFSFDSMDRRFAQRGVPAHFGVDLRISL